MRAPKNLALTVLGLCGPVHLLGFLAALIVGVKSHGRTFHALLRAPAPRAQLVLPHAATLRAHLGHVSPLTGSLSGTLPALGPLGPLGGPQMVGAAGPGATTVDLAGGVVHHHHHHVVVLQGGGYPGDAPPSKEAMAALLQLPRTLMGHQHHHPDTAMARSHTVAAPRVYQSVSTVGGGVTHQYHFHSAQDLAAAAAAAAPVDPPPPPPPSDPLPPVLPPALAPAPGLPPPTAAVPAPTPFPQHDPDAEWYARQQAARVLALLGKLRDLGIHVDEVDDEPAPAGPPPRPATQGPGAARRPPPSAAPAPTLSPPPPPPAHQHHPDKQVEHVSLVIPHVVQDTGAQVGVHVDDEDDEVMKKELVKYLIKVQKKHKELNVEHDTAGDDGDLDGFSGWKSRSDDDDVLAGGDLDIDVDGPRTSVLDEVVNLAAGMSAGAGRTTRPRD